MTVLSGAAPSRARWLFACVLLLLTGCASGPAPIVVGSKNFTENLLLGELLAQHLEARSGVPVERRLNLGGTFLCHHALRSGGIDVYPEYTGTALTAILERPVAQDPEQVFKIVSDAYREQFATEWLEPFGFNNTYAIVVRAEDAERRNLMRISDLQRVVSQFRIGFGFEFYERQDGYPGFIERYDLAFAAEPKTMDLNLVYRALRDGKIDIGVGNSTDGLISAFNMKVLEDDRRYFPPYDAAPVVRAQALEQHPGLRDTLNELSGLLTEEEMRVINYQIDGKHRPVEEVAREVLESKGLL